MSLRQWMERRALEKAWDAAALSLADAADRERAVKEAARAVREQVTRTARQYPAMHKMIAADRVSSVVMFAQKMKDAEAEKQLYQAFGLKESEVFRKLSILEAEATVEIGNWQEMEPKGPWNEREVDRLLFKLQVYGPEEGLERVDTKWLEEMFEEAKAPEKVRGEICSRLGLDRAEVLRLVVEQQRNQEQERER
jgi:hypothetical protein